MENNNNYCDLTAAAKLFPGKAHVAAVWRWCRRGIKARSGQRVRLEHVRAGGKLFTRPEWCDAFLKALAAADTEYFDARIAARDAVDKTTSHVVSVGETITKSRQREADDALKSWKPTRRKAIAEAAGDADAPLSKSRQRDVARAMKSIELRKAGKRQPSPQI